MIHISPAAQIDLIKIWIYISERVTDTQADGLIDLIENTFTLLSENQHAGLRREDISSDPNLRRRFWTFPDDPL